MHGRPFVVLAAAVVVAIGLCGPASAIVITTADGLGADAYVNAGTSANSPLGGSTSITLKNGSAADNFARKGYLRFDLAALPMAATDATLTLTVQTNNQGGSNPNPTNFTVQVFGLDDGFAGGGGILDEFWPEGSITWNNAPANSTGSGINFNSSASLLGSFAVTTSDVPGSAVSFSSQALIDFVNADTNGVISLLLRRSGSNAGGSNNLVFRPKEATANDISDAPTLDVAIPEPASLTLLGLGLLGAVRARRRRSK